jgi:hypothetical protein
MPAPHELAAFLRAGEPAVVSRIENDQLILDMRTVLRGQDNELLGCLRAALG